MIETEIDWRSPLTAFAGLAGEPYAFLLHGGERATEADWSFIGADPAEVLEFQNGETLLSGDAVAGSPFDAVRDLHRRRLKTEFAACGAPLGSGIVGVIGYECGGALEPAAAGPPSPFALPDMAVGAYDAVAAFNRQKRRAWIIGRTRAAVERLSTLMREQAPRIAPPSPRYRAAGANFTADAYRAAVREVVERIRNGELFQANISQRLGVDAVGINSSFGLFQQASSVSSAPFGAFISLSGGEVLSLSPERFFRVSRPADAPSRLRILAEPIKGTRPRSPDPQEDRRLADALLADPKDRAENIMIADLTRNDLSRICEDGTIIEEDLCALMSLSAIHHLVSRVSGVLRPDLTAADALAALFPCGSVTGAPKVQAMKAIANIERSGRGPYCGAIGYIDDRGGADFSVAIRTAIATPGKTGMQLSIPVGGGVTLRSDPEVEYAETLTKSAALLRVLGLEEDDFR